jgi:hypothetical protein
VLVIERHHPVVEDLSGGDRCLAIIQFSKGDLGIGVDHRLLIDPADTLQGADIKSILGAAITGALAVELAMRLLVGLGSHLAVHNPIPKWHGLISGVAFPYSPPEIDRGPVYEFHLNHVLVPDSPTALFRTEYEEV